MKSARLDLLSGAAMCVFAVAFYWAIVVGTRPVKAIRGRAIDVVGEMGFPTALAIVIGLGGLAIAAGAALSMWRSGRLARPGLGHVVDAGGDAQDEAGGDRRQSFLLAAALVAFVFLLPLLGYLVATPLFLVAGLLLTGYRAHATTLLFALGFTAATYAGFAYGLGVRLPGFPL